MMIEGYTSNQYIWFIGLLGIMGLIYTIPNIYGLLVYWELYILNPFQEYRCQPNNLCF